MQIKVDSGNRISFSTNEADHNHKGDVTGGFGDLVIEPHSYQQPRTGRLGPTTTELREIPRALCRDGQYRAQDGQAPVANNVKSFSMGRF